MPQAELSLSFLLRATWSDIRDTLAHEIAHAIVRPATDKRPCARRPRGPSGTPRSPAEPQRKAADGGHPSVPTPPTHDPPCQHCPYDLMIDPMTTCTAKRPSAGLLRPRGREALSAPPPTPVDDTPKRSLVRSSRLRDNDWRLVRTANALPRSGRARPSDPLVDQPYRRTAGRLGGHGQRAGSSPATPSAPCPRRVRSDLAPALEGRPRRPPGHVQAHRSPHDQHLVGANARQVRRSPSATPAGACVP